jgi:hypothetical protein
MQTIMNITDHRRRIHQATLLCSAPLAAEAVQRDLATGEAYKIPTPRTRRMWAARDAISKHVVRLHADMRCELCKAVPATAALSEVTSLNSQIETMDRMGASLDRKMSTFDVEATLAAYKMMTSQPYRRAYPDVRDRYDAVLKIISREFASIGGAPRKDTVMRMVRGATIKHH